jgi:hypothetical protein
MVEKAPRNLKMYKAFSSEILVYIQLHGVMNVMDAI